MTVSSSEAKNRMYQTCQPRHSIDGALWVYEVRRIAYIKPVNHAIRLMVQVWQQLRRGCTKFEESRMYVKPVNHAIRLMVQCGSARYFLNGTGFLLPA